MALHQSTLSGIDPAAGTRGLGSRLLQCAMQTSTSAEAIALFRSNAMLPPEANRVIESRVIKVGRTGLVLLDDMLNAGLTTPLPQWLGITEVGWDAINDVGHAQRTMVPKARGERQVADTSRTVIPIPCTWDDFSFNIREVLMAQRVGTPLDTRHVEMSTRRVNEAFEDQAWNGLGFNVKGNGAPGLLTSPVNQYSYVGGTAWTAKTGTQIKTDLLAMVQVLVDLNFPGPFNLYVSPSYNMHLVGDYNATSSDTIKDRLQALEFGSRGINIRVSNSLATNQTVLVQMTGDVVDLIVGQQPAPLSWGDGPGFEQFFMVMGCIIFRFFENYNGDQGWVVGNLA